MTRKQQVESPLINTSLLALFCDSATALSYSVRIVSKGCRKSTKTQ